MLQYLINKLYNLFVYPLNQAGGWGSVNIEADEVSKTLLIETKRYGCSYNTPYTPDSKMRDKYLNFLEARGWKIVWESPDY
jgi:hypothetical protein